MTNLSYYTMDYRIISGFKNFRYNVPFPIGVNCNPRKLTVFTVFDWLIFDMRKLEINYK